MDRQISATAFDAVAPLYDELFTDQRLGWWLRRIVWEHVDPLFLPGDRVLELGCGTGEDAIWLARKGVRVTATDGSPEMVAQAWHKAQMHNLDDRIALQVWALPDTGGRGTPRVSETLTVWSDGFDGVFSNFGVLNCLSERASLAAILADCVRPGGKVALVVMGPLCLWEIAWHLAHGQPRVALRRFRKEVEANIGEGTTTKVWYPSARTLQAEFAPYFRHCATTGIGTLLPPSYLGDVVERWTAFFTVVARADRKLGRIFPWMWLADHYLIQFERR